MVDINWKARAETAEAQLAEAKGEIERLTKYTDALKDSREFYDQRLKGAEAEGAALAEELARVKRELSRANAFHESASGRAFELTAAARQACDLLAERTHGSPARSPAHNARLLLESALRSSNDTEQEGKADV